MASILKNLAPPFDSGKTYKYGDRFVTGGHMYQVLEPFSGELDMNKLVEVTIADLVKGGYPPYDSFAGELVEAASVTSDEQNTYFGVPKPGFYNEESKIFTPNSNLAKYGTFSFPSYNASVETNIGFKPSIVLVMFHKNQNTVYLIYDTKQSVYLRGFTIYSDSYGYNEVALSGDIEITDSGFKVTNKLSSVASLSGATARYYAVK